MKKFLKVLGFIFCGIFLLVIGGAIYFNSNFPVDIPLKDVHVEVTPERVERGMYLFNHVAGCADCHTQRDMTSLGFPPIKGTEGMGGMKFGEELGVPGTVYTKNITPAALKNWTDGEILRAITEGVSKDGTALFPAMPYESFRNMDKEDLFSIIAYLRSMPPIENVVPESDIDFPVSMFIKMAPQVCETLPTAPDKNNTVEYGKYLATTVANCWHCHSPQEEHKVIPGKEYSGGTPFKVSQFGTVRSANITPDKETGIGKWTKQDFIKRFKDYADPNYKFPKTGPEDFNTLMPWAFYSGMSEQDLGAIYDYLMTIPAVSSQVEKFTIDKFQK